jgi:hypothetical protein
MLRAKCPHFAGLRPRPRRRVPAAHSTAPAARPAAPGARPPRRPAPMITESLSGYI